MCANEEANRRRPPMLIYPVILSFGMRMSTQPELIVVLVGVVPCLRLSRMGSPTRFGVTHMARM